MVAASPIKQKVSNMTIRHENSSPPVGVSPAPTSRLAMHDDNVPKSNEDTDSSHILI